VRVSERLLHDMALERDLVTFIHRTVQTVAGGTPYLHNWHVEAMAWHLQQVESGRIQRLIITLPPRCLKSITASVAFAAWVLARDPTKKLLCLSFSDQLVSKHALDCRTVMQSPWYQRAFPRTRIGRDKNRELDFVTTARGGRYATTLGGAVTGRGGDIIIMDDPLKPSDAMSKTIRTSVNETFDRTLYSRLDDKKRGAMVVVCQRLHVDDLVGHLLSKGEGWVHLSLPAIAEIDQFVPVGPGKIHVRRKGEVLHPAHEPLHVLENMRSALGTFNFSAQYQQCPIPVEGELLQWSWFLTYDELPQREGDDFIVQSWDTASKAGELNDFSVCTTWLVHGRTYYLLHVLREKLRYPALRRRAIEHAHALGADTVLIEDKGSGISLIQDLQAADDFGKEVCAVEPTEDKVTRMSSQSATIEAGRVLIPERAEWLEELRMEVLQFPHGNNDDQVDSISQFLNWIERVWCSVAVYL
jgi:predicted phage terminase large subunit-like protein